MTDSADLDRRESALKEAAVTIARVGGSLMKSPTLMSPRITVGTWIVPGPIHVG